MIFKETPSGVLVPAELPKKKTEPAAERAPVNAFVTDPADRVLVRQAMQNLWHVANMVECTGGFVNRDPNSPGAVLLKKFDDLGIALLGEGEQIRGEEYC